nr:CoA transferase [Rhodococcus sp. (in: high G+C Gram-positive bacteria)]
MTEPAILDGIRIVDFTWVGAGPFLTKPLADQGADVIKIESRNRTDPIRFMSPFADGIRGVDRSGYFANRNSSKKSICLDLKNPAGQEIAMSLIETSDVVANNYTPATLDRLGLGYADARKRRKDIIYIEMPMNGSVGPYSSHRGYGLTIAAAGGFLESSGYPDRPPVGTGTNYPDHVPNPLHGAIAVLAALRHRDRTGVGQHIELAQLASTANIVGPAVVAAALGRPVSRVGNDDASTLWQGVVRTQGPDRWCALTLRDEADVEAASSVLASSTLSGLRGRIEIGEEIAACVRERDAEDLAEQLCNAGIAASPVNDARDLLCDPQLVSREHWVTLDHPEMGPCVYDAPPYRSATTSPRLRTPAPLLGADTRLVCETILGISSTEFDLLESEGAFG